MDFNFIVSISAYLVAPFDRMLRHWVNLGKYLVNYLSSVTLVKPRFFVGLVLK
jgi:hypothetical protein